MVDRQAICDYCDGSLLPGFGEITPGNEKAEADWPVGVESIFLCNACIQLVIERTLTIPQIAVVMQANAAKAQGA